MFEFDANIISKRLLSLDSPSRVGLQDKNFIRGAVTVLILPPRDNTIPYNLVLIKRTHRKGDKHSGEMSFPGGRFESGCDKTMIDTALRETEEEIGVPRQNINLLGVLNDHITPKFFIITPVVAYVPQDQQMVKQESEVREIVKIPVNFFANKECYRERTYKLEGNRIAVGKYVYRPSSMKKYVIFGATSHIITSFLEQVYRLRLMKKGYRRLTCEDLY